MKRTLLVAMSLALASSIASAQAPPADVPPTQPRQETQAQQGEGGYGGGAYGRGDGGFGAYGAGGYGGYGGRPGGGYDRGGEEAMMMEGYGGRGEFGMGMGGYGGRSGKIDPRQTRKLIDRWKASKDASERSNLEKSLREMLKAEFSTRLAAHEKEIKQLEEKVRQLRARLDLRHEKQDEIVENRLEQLLRDAQGLGWGSEGIGGQATRLEWEWGYGAAASPADDLFGMPAAESAEPVDPQPVVEPGGESPTNIGSAPSPSAN
jgi:hypothetical protein